MKRIVLISTIFILNLTLMSTSLAGLNDGIVAYYPFNGNVNDESGNRNHGIVSGALLTEDRNGNPDSAYVFDGTDDYIEIANSESLDTRLSISIFAWVFSQGDSGPIVNYSTDSVDAVHLWETGTGDCGSDALFVKFVKRGYTNPSTPYVCKGNVLTDSEWKFVGATYDFQTGIAKVWLNGVAISSKNIGSNEIGTQYPIRIGLIENDSRFFKGKIDEIRIYNRVLDETEIQQIYNDVGENYECTDSDGDGVADQLDTCPDTVPGSWINKNGCAASGLYTQEQVDNIIAAILLWGDIDNDKKISLSEAIHALQITSGIIKPEIQK